MLLFALQLRVNMFLFEATAASLVPSEEEAIEFQSPTPTLVCSVQVTPLSEEVNMFPPLAPAASLVPSEEEAMEFQFLYPAPLCSVQVTPLLEEV